MKYLICCPLPEVEPGLYNRFITRGMATASYPLYWGDNQDDDGGVDNSEVRAWYTEHEADIPLIAEYLTRNFPGDNVEVYQLTAVHTRAIGEMESKTVDKNGVLPKKG